MFMSAQEVLFMDQLSDPNKGDAALHREALYSPQYMDNQNGELPSSMQ